MIVKEINSNLKIIGIADITFYISGETIIAIKDDFIGETYIRAKADSELKSSIEGVEYEEESFLYILSEYEERMRD